MWWMHHCKYHPEGAQRGGRGWMEVQRCGCFQVTCPTCWPSSDMWEGSLPEWPTNGVTAGTGGSHEEWAPDRSQLSLSSPVLLQCFESFSAARGRREDCWLFNHGLPLHTDMKIKTFVINRWFMWKRDERRRNVLHFWCFMNCFMQTRNLF